MDRERLKERIMKTGGNEFMTYPTFELVTPKMARKFLEHNKTNRDIRYARVIAYAKDMASGRWEEENPENGLSFDVNGNVINGQHRLLAIIKSGVSVKMWIWRDVTATIFDLPGLRTLYDSMVLGGFDRSIANKYTVAITKMTFEGIYHREKILTTGPLQPYIEKYGNDMMLAVSISKSKKSDLCNIQNTSIQTAFYCSLRFGISEKTLRDFAEIVISGIYTYEWQTPAIYLRNYLIGRKRDGAIRMSGRSVRLNALAVALRAIEDYHNKLERKKAYNPDRIGITGIEKFVASEDFDFVEGICSWTEKN